MTHVLLVKWMRSDRRMRSIDLVIRQGDNAVAFDLPYTMRKAEAYRDAVAKVLEIANEEIRVMPTEPEACD